MKKINFKSSTGQASRLLLILAIVILVAVVITYLIIKMAEKPASPAENSGENSTVAVPVYEQTLGDIRFIFESAIDRDGVLRASQITNSQYTSSNQKDFIIDNTGAKFIQVIVGAQNTGKEDISQNAWDIGDIVDSEGRHFAPITDYNVSPWLPNPNLCGALLHPAFDPIPCTKFYEVSKQSTGLKITIETGINNSTVSSGRTSSFLLDLIVK